MTAAMSIPIAGFKNVYDTAAVDRALQKLPAGASEGLKSTYAKMLETGGARPAANFDYSGPMTETVLLGVLALRIPGTRLEWDSTNLKVKNAPEVNPFTHTEYRKGWAL